MEQKEWNKGHARLRAKQRYNLDLTSREYDRLVKALANPKRKYKGIEHEAMGRISKWKSVHKIFYMGKCLYALYSIRQHNIQTFFPLTYDFLKMKMYAVSHNLRIDF